MKQNLLSKSVVFTCVFVFCYTVCGWADSFDRKIDNCLVRVVYKNPSPPVCDAIILGVGTAMWRSDYDKLAAEIADTYGYAVVIMDHNPYRVVKKDPDKFTNCALRVKSSLLSWLAEAGCKSISHWVMGGHSAGGQAAQNAVSSHPGLADAIFSIDPYDCSHTGAVTVPSLYWGFNVTSCFVVMDKAAKAAYLGCNGPRVFYRVKKMYTCGPCGYAPKFFHCSFCDSHCPMCTNCKLTPGYFYDDVAESVHKFITAAFYGTWSKANLTAQTTTPVDIFVDIDQP